MKTSLKISACLSLLFGISTIIQGQSQTWKPAMNGIWEGFQYPSITDIRFKDNGPLGKDWIYGKWLDEDSITRYAAYREGGKWVPLPITGYFNGGQAYDIVQYGDTMYLGGIFTAPVLKGDSVPLPWVGIIKYWSDSLWYSTDRIQFLYDFSVSGDSLLVWPNTYFGPTDTLFSHILSTDGGSTWNYPYSIPHPPAVSWSGFGAYFHLEIRDGDIYTLNDGSDAPYNGIVRWDGQQWHSYGNGLYGTYAQATNFEFYKDELYLAGSFSKEEDPRNPGGLIAKWNGHDWEEVGGGLTAGPFANWVFDLFVADSMLYCHTHGSWFGDANIPYLAAWNGQQWCGTPINYTGNYSFNYGVVNDTLYAFCMFLPSSVNGQALTYLNYFDGDYVNGPNAICSTPGLGEEQQEVTQTSFEFFPNPVREEMGISGAENLRSLKIYDLAGRCVLRQQLSAKSYEVRLDVSRLLPGIYLLEVNGQKERKFVKE